MPDHDCRTLFMRQFDRGLQLRGNRRLGAFVIEKYIPRHMGQTDLLRLGGGDGLRTGAAVDEELVTPLQLTHQPGHRCRLCGHAAAHVVVDAGGVGHGFKCRVQAFAQFFDGQLRVPGEWAGGRVHGHVQDHDLASLVGLTGKFGGVGRVRHDGGGHRAG